jgi:thiol-disulfide isomerase/thioredoxin
VVGRALPPALIALGALGAAAALAFASAAAAREPLALATLDGERVSLAPAPGERALLVHFWATWCASCAEELPVVARAADACAPQGVRVRIAAAGESATRVRSYLRAHGLAFEALLDPNGRAWRAAGGSGLPANWIRNDAGERLLHGPRSHGEWSSLLAALGCSFPPPRVRAP